MRPRAAIASGLPLAARAAILLALASCSAPSPREAVPGGGGASQWSAVSASIRVNRVDRAVEFDAVAVLRTGFLEEYVCTVGTREHESLFAFDGKASEIHAALLLAGLEPGAPGRWRTAAANDGEFALERVPPTGAPVAVSVLLPDGRELTLDHFVRAAPLPGAAAAVGQVPPREFVFAGSRFVRSRRTAEERYAADGSGSLIGLVTFGDETIGPVEVIADQASVSEPLWEAFTERMPDPGTKVRVRIRACSERVNKIKGPVETEPQTEPFRGQGGGAKAP